MSFEPKRIPDSRHRRLFIGGSDARIIMGDDEAALVRLWKEKRGDVDPEDLSGDLLVQLGAVTEQLNRHWYEKNTEQVGHDVGMPPHTQRVRLPGLRSRTPCPPPFSSMKSTPADLIALTIRSAVSPRPPRVPSKASRRLIVGIDTSAALARSSWDQSSSARAALSWRIDTFSIDFSPMPIDTFSIDILPNRRSVGWQ
jgi:hypothetical protein